MAKDKKSKKSGAPGTAGIAEQWDAAAKTTNGAKDKPTDKRPPVQTRLDLGDERVEYQEIEIEVPLSPAEAILLERRATEQLAEADEEQGRLDKHNEITVKPWKAKIAELKQKASKDAADAKAHKRKIKQRTKVVYYPNTATVRFLHPDTGEDVMLSRAMTPQEMTDMDPETEAGDDVIEPPPASAPRIEVPAGDTVQA